MAVCSLTQPDFLAIDSTKSLYYQGNFWQSAFSSSWGINSIPRVFVVDQEGKLYSVDARGKLETIIPALLKDKLAAAPAGRATIGG